MEQDYDSGEMHMRGFYAGDDVQVYTEACKLARAVNITHMAGQQSRLPHPHGHR